MKKIKLIFAGMILTNMSALAQPVTAPVPTTVPTQAANAWYAGGNNLNGPNVFGFLAGQNSQIWYQTNGFNRMMMNNGANANTDGRIVMGNNIPAGFAPQARLHLLQFGTGAPNANMFRTDGNSNAVNQWQLYTGTTATATTQKFRLFVPATLSDVGLHSAEDMFFMTGPGTLTAPIVERMRIHESSGNIAIGTPWVDPNIRMNVLQDAQNQGVSTNPNIYDIVFQGRISDDTLSNIRLMNGTNGDNYFVPQLAGYNSKSSIGPGPLTPRFQGLVVSGAISLPADLGIIPLGSTAVVEFDARKRNPDGTGQAAVTRRDLFQWCNFNILEMLMNARGQLGINQANWNSKKKVDEKYLALCHMF